MITTEIRTILSIGVGAMLFGCTSTNSPAPHFVSVNKVQTEPTIVVLRQRHVTHKHSESDYLECLTDDLAVKAAPYSVLPEQQFFDAMYPYFEPSTAPLHISHLNQMLQEPAVAQKLDDLKLRYLVFIEGKTRKVNNKGAVSCGISPAGGGCLGLATWDDEAEYAASIWDLQNLSVAGNVDTRKSGTSYLPALIVPIPLLSGAQDSACRDMAIGINNHLVY